MSPVNNDPSQDETVATGRLPLTRRELRARERFLATQNQDQVPAPAYAFADVEHQVQPREHPDEPKGEPSPVRGSADDAGRHPATVSPAPLDPPTIQDGIPAVQDEIPAVPEAPDAPAAPEASFAREVPEKHAADDAGLHPGAEGVVPASPSRDAEAHDVHFEEAHHREVAYAHVDGHYEGTDDHYQAGHAVDLHEAHDPHYIHDDAHHYAAGDHEYDGHNHVVIGAESVPTAPKPSKKVRRRRRLLAVLLTLGVFVAAISIGVQFLRPLLGMDKVSDYPGPGTGSVTITVPPGSGPKAVATELENQRVVANADSFLKEFLASGGELSPGDFQFRNEMKNSDAVAVLLNRDASKVMYFALNAGLRINESLDTIAKGSGIPLEQLKALSDSPAQFGVPPKAKNLEGFLAPGEYRFPLGTSAKDILQKLVNTTLDELKAQGITDPAKQYDIITVASIVQAEGGQADYGNVAGAIYNRLKPNNTETSGLIQSDATVTYGLGRKSFHIDEAEKADKSNPYNTYANPGLPVGPIGSPGKTAIDAAAKPTPNDYLYWVTINLDTKETKFSKTLAEHSRYVEEYNAWCGANPGRCV